MDRKLTVKNRFENEPKGKSEKRSYNNLLILVVGQSSFDGSSRQRTDPTDQLALIKHIQLSMCSFLFDY